MSRAARLAGNLDLYRALSRGTRTLEERQGEVCQESRREC